MNVALLSLARGDVVDVFDNQIDEWARGSVLSVDRQARSAEIALDARPYSLRVALNGDHMRVPGAPGVPFAPGSKVCKVARRNALRSVDRVSTLEAEPLFAPCAAAEDVLGRLTWTRAAKGPAALGDLLLRVSAPERAPVDFHVHRAMVAVGPHASARLRAHVEFSNDAVAHLELRTSSFDVFPNALTYMYSGGRKLPHDEARWVPLAVLAEEMLMRPLHDDVVRRLRAQPSPVALADSVTLGAPALAEAAAAAILQGFGRVPPEAFTVLEPRTLMFLLDSDQMAHAGSEAAVVGAYLRARRGAGGLGIGDVRRLAARVGAVPPRAAPQLWRAATTGLGLERLARKCRGVVVEHLEAISADDLLCELSSELLEDALRDDKLAVRSEDTVLALVDHAVRVHGHSRSLFSCVRFPFVSRAAFRAATVPSYVALVAHEAMALKEESGHAALVRWAKARRVPFKLRPRAGYASPSPPPPGTSVVRHWCALQLGVLSAPLLAIAYAARGLAGALAALLLVGALVALATAARRRGGLRLRIPPPAEMVARWRRRVGGGGRGKLL